MTVKGGRRTGLAFIGQWRWILLGIAAITAFILGFIGVGEKEPLGIADRVYTSIQLFRFSTPFEPPYPTDLEIARFLALASIAYAAFRGFSAIFREQWARFRVANFLHDHVVVCGLGYSGMRLAKSFRKMPNGTKVVAIDLVPSIADVEECRELGIYCMTGDVTDGGFLKQTGIGRARSVVVTCGDDDVNAQVALLAQNAPSERRHAMTCYVNIDEDELCRLLVQSAMSSRGRIHFEFFNVYRSGPRALLDVHGHRGNAATREAPGPLLVVGNGRMVAHMVSEQGRRWALERGDGADRLQIMLVAPTAGPQGAALRARHPGFDDVCELVPYEADLSDPDAPDPPIEAVPTRVFVCFDDDAVGLRATIRVRRWIATDVPIVLCTTGRSHAAHLLQMASSSEVLPNVTEFGLLDEVCTAERLQNGFVETIAQAIHAEFVREQTGIKPRDAPTMREWKDLPEEFKESNRSQARDYRKKLELVDCHIVESTRWGLPRFAFTESEVRKLAVREHDRWCEEKRQDGWTYGDPRDDVLRHNPCLVDWEKLPESEREKDRSTVRWMPTFLAKVGYEIVRTTGEPGASNGAAPARPPVPVERT